MARRDALDERHAPHVEAEPLEQLEVAAAPVAEPEPVPRRHDLRPDRAEHRGGERLGRERRERASNRTTSDVLDPELLEQLQPPLRAS